MSLRLEKCSSCGALMFWATSERGRPIPMDPLPLPPGPGEGNMALRWNEQGQLIARVLGKDRHDYDGPLYQTHFMSCPWAGHHRSDRKRKTG